DLKIKLAERSTGAIIGGVGYSTYSKFGVSASIQENNLWGKGYGLGFQTFFSSMRTSYDVSFSNPRVNDSNLALGLNLYRWEDDYTDYNRDTMGGGIRLGYPVGEYSSVGIGYRAEFYKLYDFDSGVTQTLRQYEGKRTASVLSLYLTRDTTDHMRPSSGTIVQLAAEYGGGLMGGDDAFVKLMPEYQFYQAITENSVAHLKLRGGILFESDRDNPPPVFERFWIGGIDSIRGYRSRDIVPRDPYSADRIGGDRMAYANLEYIYQVSKDIGINLVPFFDIGVNVDSTQKFEWKKAQKKSAGLELRWRSPMGDLRFSWGYPFDKGWYDEKLTSRFEFSIGNFF
ncbi:MAG: BamA/TamA family outer membrane protein, partial [Deltaproteobacteria bacterium]|nr:BamA/TamA family outer membrane protein [Deltaproteobacteria bacterium]